MSSQLELHTRTDQHWKHWRNSPRTPPGPTLPASIRLQAPVSRTAARRHWLQDCWVRPLYPRLSCQAIALLRKCEARQSIQSGRGPPHKGTGRYNLSGPEWEKAGWSHWNCVRLEHRWHRCPETRRVDRLRPRCANWSDCPSPADGWHRPPRNSSPPNFHRHEETNGIAHSHCYSDRYLRTR